jgi:chromate transport protein ChrA
MDTSGAFLAVSVAVLAIVAVLVFRMGRRRGENRLTPLASLAWGFILAAILFGDDRLIGYVLMGIGVILAFVDIFNRSKNR